MPGKSHGQRSLVGVAGGGKELDMTEQLNNNNKSPNIVNIGRSGFNIQILGRHNSVYNRTALGSQGSQGENGLSASSSMKSAGVRRATTDGKVCSDVNYSVQLSAA